MRTATALFEEVLDAYDDGEITRIMGDLTPEAATGTVDRLEAHAAKVRAYREEFREAMQRDELCCPNCGRPYALHGINCPTLSEPVALSAAEQALADANPSTCPEGVVDPELLQALKDGLKAAHKFRRESISERSERLAERHTRDDGSPR